MVTKVTFIDLLFRKAITSLGYNKNNCKNHFSNTNLMEFLRNILSVVTLLLFRYIRHGCDYFLLNIQLLGCYSAGVNKLCVAHDYI